VPSVSIPGVTLLRNTRVKERISSSVDSGFASVKSSDRRAGSTARRSDSSILCSTSPRDGSHGKFGPLTKHGGEFTSTRPSVRSGNVAAKSAARGPRSPTANRIAESDLAASLTARTSQFALTRHRVETAVSVNH
jgi:hypothetical protein